MSMIFAERPRYYEGQYLGAEDLAILLEYVRDRGAQHLLGAHTWGVVTGIEIVEGTAPGGEPEYFLAPGLAVDGFGRLLVVPRPLKLTNDLFAQQPSGTVDVWIRYDESAYSNLRAGFQVCECSDEFTRVAESVVVEVGPRDVVAQRTSPVVVGDQSFADAREAVGAHLPSQPLACDGSVAAQAFPFGEQPSLWLIPVGQVPWNKAAGALLGSTEADRKGSRILRRQAGLVAEHIYPAAGVLRIRPRWTARQAGKAVDAVCAEDVIREADLVTCGGELTFREMIWLEGDVRFRRDARLYGGTLEFQEAAGTDYLVKGVPLALRRRPDRNEHRGFDLEVLLGERRGTDGPTRLVVGKARAQGADPCSTAFAFDPGVYVQEDAKVGIGTTVSLLKLPLTIRAVGGNGDLTGFEAADGSLAWQLNLGSNRDGLNFTEDDPAATRLFLASGGDVGIATFDPEAKLDVRDVSAPSTGNALGVGKWLQVGDGGDKGRFWLQYGDQRAPLLVLSDLDDPPRVRFQQNGTGTETAPEHSSWIGHARGKSPDVAIMGGQLGVGTLGPFARLTVDGSLGFKPGPEPMIYMHESGTANAERMVLSHSPAFPDWGLSYRDSSDAFHFLRAGVEVMSIDLSSGRAGIGTTSPAERLEVRGNIKLGANGDFFGVGCTDNVRMVAGRVSQSGAVLAGSGFSAQRLGTGRYRVNYSQPFSSAAIVVATLVDTANRDNFLTVVNSTASSFELHSRDDRPMDSADYQDSAFHFVALGPRA